MSPVWSALLLFGQMPLEQATLPDGPEKKTVVQVCGTCHTADVVIGMVNTREGWKNLVDEMVTRGAVATEIQKRQIVRYLTRNYPQKQAGK